MPLKDIKQYIDWFIEGDATLHKRLDMFVRQNKKLEEQMAPAAKAYGKNQL